MSLFSTEFYLKDTIGAAEFLAEARAWAQGMKRTRLFDPDSRETRDGDNIDYRAANGESLMLRALGKGKNLTAIGCRHDLPADTGLNWRTEAVMRKTARGNLLRVRAQCLPMRPLAVPETPKRTHLIRSLIENGRVMDDGPLPVQTGPHLLLDTSACNALAADIASGAASCALPVVYLSVSDGGQPPFDACTIDRLAMDVCGLAHVVVEPSRTFSFAVRDRSHGRNVYAGTIGISVPGRGFVRRMYLGPLYHDLAELAEATRRAAVELRSAMPSQDGWDWHDLQDGILADHRKRDARRLSVEENDKLWQEELASRDERVRELDSQVKALQRTLREAAEAGSAGLLPEIDAPEIWRGEFSDRIRAALLFCLEKGGDAGWDKRSLAVFDAVSAGLRSSADLDELRADLKRATRDAKRLNAEVKRVLLQHGYVDKSDNKHSRLEPAPGYIGLDSITLMKTPSEHRGPDNLVSQIEGALGIARLKQAR